MIETVPVKVSVIMPVYNAEQFLEETLDTVINQTLKEIEIICVDDGSKDSSLAILQTYADKDKRITILQQENQYAGIARNHGLKIASGKYVVFWDADDLFSADALQLLYQQSERDDADICVCSALRMESDTKEVMASDMYLMKSILPDQVPFSKQDIPGYIFNFATNVPWNKMFRREFVEVNQLQFASLRQANDTYFVIMAFFFAEKITYIDQELIRYRVENEFSLTGRSSDTVFCAYESYVNVLEEISAYSEFKGKIKQSFVNRAISGFLYSLSSQHDFTAYKSLYEFLVSEGFQRFDITNREESYFYMHWQYAYVQNMFKMTPEQFLLEEVKKRKKRMAVRAAKIEKLKEKLKSKDEIIQKQKQKLNCLPVRIVLKVCKVLTLNGRLGKKYRNLFQ